MAKIVKPTLDTKFHIDFKWWQTKGKNLRSQIRSHLCSECQESFEDGETFDWVDPATGEVFELDTMWHCAYTKCSQAPEFIDTRTPVTAAIFRAFITTNNAPLTPIEIYEKIQKKSPELILRTIGGRNIYQGIRPITTL